MPVYHIGIKMVIKHGRLDTDVPRTVLFKLKPGVTDEQKAELMSVGSAMVGQIPGLTKINFGAPLPITAARSQGFDMGLVAILEKPDDIPVYAAHPAHQKVHKFREALCDDTLAYDLEFPG